MDFERSSVDGVPVFWAEAGEEMVAGLMFRVGRADESLARGGMERLVPSEPSPGRGLTRRREGGLAAFRLPVRAPYRFRKG